MAYRAEYMKIPEEIKGVKLNEHQKQTLLEGKPLYLKNKQHVIVVNCFHFSVSLRYNTTFDDRENKPLVL